MIYTAITWRLSLRLQALGRNFDLSDVAWHNPELHTAPPEEDPTNLGQTFQAIYSGASSDRVGR